VDQEGNVKFLKDKYWEPAGKCISCGDLGLTCFHCKKRCNPLGFLYVLESMTLDEIVSDDPRSEGRMAHIAHSVILDQPNPAAAHSQFLPFFDSCWGDDKPFWD
jgi:hypothetical protein